jgi:hypothetical protein
MEKSDLRPALNLALAICGHDGYLSDTELGVLNGYFCATNSMLGEDFSAAVDAFFDSEEQLEALVAAVADTETALDIAEEAAASDGLDPRENFALIRCRQFSEARRETI